MIECGVAASESGGLTGNGSIDIPAGVLSIDQVGNTGFGGSVIGSGGLQKSGSGLFQLLGVSSYSGPTTISAGSLQFTAPSRSFNNATAVSISSGAKFLIDPDVNSVTYSGSVSGAGDVRMIGNGTLNLTGNLTYSGVTEVGSGALVVNDLPGDDLENGVLPESTVVDVSSGATYRPATVPCL